MIQQFLALVACLAIVALTEPVINRMSRETPFLLRFSIWLLCVAAVAAIFYILIGNEPAWPAVFGAIGIAVYLIAERRNHKHHKKWTIPS